MMDERRIQTASAAEAARAGARGLGSWLDQQQPCLAQDVVVAYELVIAGGATAGRDAGTWWHECG